MTVICNEFDPYAAEWCRNLIRDGHAPAGIVDERDLWDIAPVDLMNYKQVHLCAGILGWPAALRLAGWDDDRYIFTCSAPCQGLSTAGKGLGFADERHLWPAIFHIIEALRPPVIVGEQVASSLGKIWLDLVFDDLEALGYTCWAIVLPVSSVGAPGERHRIFWLAHADGRECRGVTDADRRYERDGSTTGRIESDGLTQYDSITGRMAHADDDRCDQRRSSLTTTGNDGFIGDNATQRLAHAAPLGRGESGPDGSGARCRDGAQGQPAGFVSGGASVGMGDPSSARHAQQPGERGALPEAVCPLPGQTAERTGSPVGGLADPSRGGYDGSGDVRGRWSESPDHRDDGDGHTLQPDHPWRDSDWLLCSDPGGPRWRPIKAGDFPMAPGLPRGMGTRGPRLARYATMAGADADSLRRAKRYRIGSLRGYGNAINIQVAAEWIKSWMDDVPQ